VSTIPGSLRALLSDLIDYAGLFPPAALPMQQAVENYARYLAGPDAWALARFVLPVSRFGEFEAAMSSVRMIEPWGLSALLGKTPEADLAEVDRFNDRNQGRAVVDSVEVKADNTDEICHIRAFVRGSITCYFEIPTENPAAFLPTIHAIHARAKIRTGGVTPNAFPSSESLAHFILECAKYDVAFKATAGLHHPLRCVRPLTYEADAETSIMHGFLNVFMAACAVSNGRHLPLEDVDKVRFLAMLLDGRNPELRFTDEIASIDAEGEHKQLPESYVGDPRYPGGRAATGISVARIREARHSFAISFGSCSFEEPLSDLRELKLL
jgi:hypothetical protein